MERVFIRGGRLLEGRLVISGAKNAVLKLMAASLMARGECVIRNVPAIKDVFSMIKLLQNLGADVDLEDGVMRIRTSEDLLWEAPEEFVREMRASIQVMGPLLARLGKARVSLPGGCAIGARPVDMHVRGLRSLGAEIIEKYGYITAQADTLQGCEIHQDYPSVGATENIMMASTTAAGTTIIRNAAREPEIIEVQNFLNCMGACVRGAGTDAIRVQGVESLGNCEYTVIPDRIEAGTYMVAVAVTGGDVLLENVIPDHVESVLAKLREAGVDVVVQGETVRVRGSGRARPVNIRTQPHPGFPTDMQPQMVTLLALAEGTSIITETVHTSRFKYVDELRRMGGDITVDGRTAVVKGVPALTGARVEATDLRGGAALILAGLVAEGETVVEDVHHIDRGYDDIVSKFRSLGADITRSDESTVDAALAQVQVVDPSSIRLR